MRSAAVPLFLILFALLISAPVMNAVGRVTTDPNASSAAAGPIADPSVDQRLTQKVTYEARYKALKLILADLTQMTGVKLNAGVSPKDWQVRDRRMNIFAKDTPLAALMSSIARAMKFKWSKNTEKSPPTYRIFMDRKTLLGAETTVEDIEKKLDEDAKANRQKLADFIMAGNKPTDDELAAMKTSDPFRYALYTRGTYDIYNAMFTTYPDLKKRFLNSDWGWEHSVASLSPSTQQLLVTAVQKQYAIDNPGKTFPDALVSKLLSGGTATFELMPRKYLPSVNSRDWLFGGMGVFIGDQWYCVGKLRDLDDARSNALSKVETDMAEGGSASNADTILTQAFLGRNAEICKQDPKLQPGEPLIEHPDEPALHTKVKLEKSDNTLTDLQSALAKASGLAVVSDSFRLTTGLASVAGSEKELADVLSAIANGYYYNWDKHGPVIEFRSRFWFRYRSCQIPDEWVENWIKDTKKTNVMPIDDLAQICWLTVDQLRENVYSDEFFARISPSLTSREYTDNVEMMRLYSMMTAEQRKLMESEPGVPVQSLSPEQSAQAHKMIWAIPDDGYFRAKYGTSQDGQFTQWKWSIWTTDGKLKGSPFWPVALPRYFPPAKPTTPASLAKPAK